MSTMTAQILIGQSHTYHGGINPSHYLFLSENSKPALILLPQNYDKSMKSSESRKIWIPTLENMLEDALVMIAVNVLKDEQVISLANKYINSKDDNYVYMYDDIEAEDRKKLYQASKIMNKNYKIVISIFQGSSLFRHLPKLKDYNMEVEVNMPKYVRRYNAMNEEMITEGNLDLDKLRKL